MSSINIEDIVEGFPEQGKDNPSKGFRDNFNAIKVALGTAKSEITQLQTNTAKTNADNNFNNKKLEQAIFNNTHLSFNNHGDKTGQFELNVQDYMVHKIKFTGPGTIRFKNWPLAGELGKCHGIKIHVQFDFVQYNASSRINFSTDQGVPIKGSGIVPGAFNYDVNVGGWHLLPYVNEDISNVKKDYEHVIEVWSYNPHSQTNGAIFVNYLGSFI